MGMISPKERKKQIEIESREQNKPKVPKSSKKEESKISGFDLDSVLSSTPSEGTASEFGGGSSSVVATAESIEMDRGAASTGLDNTDYTYQEEPKPAWTPPKRESRREQFSNNVVSQQPEQQKREHFSSVAPKATKSSPTVKKKKTVRKRKSVKKPEPEPATEPENETKKSSFSGDDDFSDFSM